MNLDQRYPRDLEEEGCIGWTGYVLLAVVILLSAGIVERLADYIKPMSWLMSFLGMFV